MATDHVPPPHSPHVLRARFRAHLTANVSMAAAILVVSIAIGMAGYHEFAGLPWVDAFLNAAMILSGMGPVAPLTGDRAKLFAGIYALYCGVIFVATVSLILAPVLAHVLRRFHLMEHR